MEDDICVESSLIEESNKFIASQNIEWDMIKWGLVYKPLFLWLNLGVAKAKLEFYERKYSHDPK